MLKLFKVVLIGTAFMASISHADVATTYKQTCATCHDSGALNAPKKGDKSTWDKLKSQKGMDGLIKSTKKGMPKGCARRAAMKILEP